MILIVNVCSDELSYFEFIKPIEDILENAKIEFVSRNLAGLNHTDISRAERVIISGTALKDFKYLDNLHRFAWINETQTPILGICAGMQVLAALFEGDIIERKRIGRYKVKIVKKNILSSKQEFHSYFLNSIAVEPHDNFDTLGESGKLKCIFKHKRREFYGCLFHPEVLNPEIITNFARW
jgi:GMP synthase-like glutamine amidotransferase